MNTDKSLRVPFRVNINLSEKMFTIHRNMNFILDKLLNLYIHKKNKLTLVAASGVVKACG